MPLTRAHVHCAAALSRRRCRCTWQRPSARWAGAPRWCAASSPTCWWVGRGGAAAGCWASHAPRTANAEQQPRVKAGHARTAPQVCLAVWLANAARDASGKILGIYLPIMSFTSIGWVGEQGGWPACDGCSWVSEAAPGAAVRAQRRTPTHLPPRLHTLPAAWSTASQTCSLSRWVGARGQQGAAWGLGAAAGLVREAGGHTAKPAPAPPRRCLQASSKAQT